MSMEYHEQYYEVPPGALAWRMHQLGQMPNTQVLGYQQSAAGTYIIIVQAPVGAPQATFAPPPRPVRRPAHVDWRMIVQLACVAAIVGALIYLGVSLAQRTASEPAPVAAPAPAEDASWWDSLPALPELRLPWAADDAAPDAPGEPVVELVDESDDGFRWPWEAAQEAAQEAIDGAVNAVRMGVALLLLVVVVGGILYALRRV